MCPVVSQHGRGGGDDDDSVGDDGDGGGGGGGDNGTWFTFANLSGNSLDWMSSAPGPEGKIQRNYEVISKID